MNPLVNPNLEFRGMGRFTCKGEWIHPQRIETTYEIIYVTEGEVFMHDGDRDIVASAGQLMLLYPGILHFGNKVTSGVSFYWLHFELKNGCELPFGECFLSHFDNSYLFKEILHYSNLPNSPAYLVNAILVRILSEICLQTENAPHTRSKIAGEIYEWIRINASAVLTAEKIADHFCFSPDHVARILRKDYGIGTKAAMDMFLIQKAKNLLLNTNRYIKEIAYELGFESDNAFVAFFKYHEGIYPSAFRNRYYGTHLNNH